MAVVVKRVAIIGLGLIGGSLGMAIRKRRLAREVVGFSRRPATLKLARKKGAIDRAAADLRAAVLGADVVVLATPVGLIVPLGRKLARWMKPGGVLTDVGSTKAQIASSLAKLPKAGVVFVGAHPIAGSEQRGIEAASAGLFDGSLCVLTPTRKTASGALKKIKALWRPLVGQVITMDPKKHDRLLASLSHLPHMVAFSLAGSVGARELPQTPRSFLDMTRIAQSDPDLWDDILLSNRAPLLKSMDGFSKQWLALRRALGSRNAKALRRILAQAKSKRDAFDHG